MGIAGFFKSILFGRQDVLARFEIQHKAISGTMSKFYKVRERESGRILGLKILDPAQVEALNQRLKGVRRPSEGEISLSLDHPQIMKTYEQGKTSKGEEYLVVEFLDGPGLNSLIVGRSEQLQKNCLALIRQAAEAIHAVHAAGYIHRDICPRNFVANREVTSLKLIDFGLTLPATEEFTKPGNRTGTPQYMAPEIVRRRPTDHRVDIFSFGITAYEMITFERPWDAGTDGRAALSHGSIDPKPIAELRRSIDPVLAEQLMKCLANEPDERHRSMEDFLAAISRVKSIDQEGERS